MSVIKRIRNVGVLTPCLSADQSSAGESSDLHPREKRPAHGDGGMEGQQEERREGGQEVGQEGGGGGGGGMMMTRRWE